MLDFDSARQRFIDVARVLGSERVALCAAAGRVLTEPLRAARAVPEFDTSAMDGYAVHIEDAQAVPYRLLVEGEAPAGAAPARLRRGTAMRIFTGAAMPLGSNAVVMQEHVHRDEQAIRGEKPVTVGQNVRLRGEDLPAAALALDRGQRLHPGALALASFLDLASVEVARAPRLTILCTGSELRLSGTESRPGTIAESNSTTVSLLAQQAGAAVLGTELVDDDEQRLRAAVEKGLVASDVLVTIGGVSVGEYDFVRPTLEAAGVTLELCQVGIKPGKPITLGHREGKVIIGLPGNPASAIITFALFALPLLRAMQGDRCPIPLPIWLPLAQRVRCDATRTRVVLGNLISCDARTGFAPHANQTSGATIALGQTDGLVILEPSTDALAVGAMVPYHRWTDL